MLRLRGQRRTVDQDAGPLDVSQHGQKRHFQVAKHLVEGIGDEERRETIGQLTGEIGPFSREVQRCLGRDGLRSGWPLRRARTNRPRSAPCSRDVRARSLPADVPVAWHREDSWQASSRTRGPFELDAVIPEHDGVDLQVVADLADGGIFEQRSQAARAPRAAPPAPAQRRSTTDRRHRRRRDRAAGSAPAGRRWKRRCRRSRRAWRTDRRQ